MPLDKLIDSKKIKDRFLKKVDQSESHTTCHIWLASKNKTGHVCFLFLEKLYLPVDILS